MRKTKEANNDNEDPTSGILHGLDTFLKKNYRLIILFLAVAVLAGTGLCFYLWDGRHTLAANLVSFAVTF